MANEFSYTDDLKRLTDIVAHQKEYIKALISGQESLQKLMAEKDAEIERLQGRNKRLESAFVAECDLSACPRKQEIKNEAIKEFAEKVNLIVEELVDIMFDGNEPKCKISNCHKHSSIPCESPTCIEENKAYWKIRIFNLVKEMVGDGDA